MTLPNRFFSSVHVRPNLGIPLTREFKIASINLASLYKNIDQLRIYMLSKTVDILAINEINPVMAVSKQINFKCEED